MSRKPAIPVAIALTIVLLFVTACGGTAAPTAEPQPPTSTLAPTSEIEVVSTEEQAPTATPQPLATPTPELPDTSGVLSVGELAPDFTLQDSNGDEISLSIELSSNQYVVLVFYHGAT